MCIVKGLRPLRIIWKDDREIAHAFSREHSVDKRTVKLFYSFRNDSSVQIKALWFLILLVPFSLCAQLDRVHPGMTEQAFAVAFPEATRDYERESSLAQLEEKVASFQGNARWHVFKDTVVSYSFTSECVAGPVQSNPTIDSSLVHQMKLALDRLRIEFESAIGQPSEFVNVELSTFIPSSTSSFVYAAVWRKSNLQVASLIIREATYSANMINASEDMLNSGPKYCMEVQINSNDKFFKTKYGLGVSRTELSVRNPSLANQLVKSEDVLYYLSDTATSENAEWSFLFMAGKLTEIYFEAYRGVEYGAESDSMAYLVFKRKAESLLREGNKQYGKPDTISDRLTPKRNVRDLHLSYEENYLYSIWTSQTGLIILNFQEFGGGKNPGIVFKLSVEFSAGQ